MTTIAYRNGVLAADSAMCSGGTLMGSIDKIARRNDGALAGAAGDAAFNAAFRAWFLAWGGGAQPEVKEGEGWMDRGVIFRPDGAIEVFEPRGKFVCVAKYFAFGSGKETALGAMFAGADAETAVRAAIEHDPHTAGAVLVLRHDS